MAQGRKESLEIKRILVGVAGGSAAGKTTLCNNIRKEMTYDGEFNVLIVPLDCFYKGVDKTKIDPRDYNFDHPDALDFDQAYNCLLSLLNGQTTEIPRYNFCTHSPEEEKDLVEPTDVILFEGILALYDPRICDLMQYKIFMHCDDDIRLCRRIVRDVKERGRDVEGVLFQYNRFVKRSFDEYIKPTMNCADMIVPGSRNNMVSVQFIVQHLKAKAKLIGMYKKTIKKQIVFDGEVVESFEHSIMNVSNKKENYSLSEDLSFQKCMVFPKNEVMKREIHSIFIKLTEEFNYNQAQSVFKEYIKHAVSLWEKLSLLNNAQYHEVQVLSLFDFFSVDRQQNSEFKKYVILPFHLLQPENEQIIVEQCQWFAKNKPNVKIIIIALLGSLSQFASLKSKCNNILHFINILCIANREQFTKTINENYSSESQVKFFDWKFMQDDLYKKTQSYLKKIYKASEDKKI